MLPRTLMWHCCDPQVRRALKSAYFHRVKVTPPGETKARLMWTPCSRWSRGSKKVRCCEQEGTCAASLFLGSLLLCDEAAQHA